MWILTHDYFDDGKLDNFHSKDWDVSKIDGLTHRLRLLDDDDELCFEGVSNRDCALDANRALVHASEL